MEINLILHIFAIQFLSGWILTGSTAFLPESWLGWLRSKGGWPKPGEPAPDELKMNRLGEALTCWVCAGFWPGALAAPVLVLASDYGWVDGLSALLLSTGLLLLSIKFIGD